MLGGERYMHEFRCNVVYAQITINTKCCLLAGPPYRYILLVYEGGQCQTRRTHTSRWNLLFKPAPASLLLCVPSFALWKLYRYCIVIRLWKCIHAQVSQVQLKCALPSSWLFGSFFLFWPCFGFQFSASFYRNRSWLDRQARHPRRAQRFPPPPNVILPVRGWK